MPLTFDERRSDVTLVQTVWRTHSELPGTFTSVAVTHWEMVVTRRKGTTTLTVRGPETKATLAPIPSDAQFFGIAFNHGAFMPALPTEPLVDKAIDLPHASDNSFWLQGRAWRFPSYENADAFVGRLVRAGVLVLDHVVDDAVRRRPTGLSRRTVRRRFQRATGLTPAVIGQIDRARHATALLQRGVSILDTVNETGYFDQSHLSRSLKQFTGYTPGEILRMNGFAEMSLSYKTAEFRERNDRPPTGRSR